MTPLCDSNLGTSIADYREITNGKSSDDRALQA